MADQEQKLTLEDLMISTLAMTDAAVKLLIQKGLFSEEEFRTQLGSDRAHYIAILKRLH